MSPRRFQLDGATLTEVRQRVRAEHGPTARIVAVEQVTTGGLGGFFATRRFAVTVEVPDGPTEAVDAHDLDQARRVGLAALLDEADAADGAPGRPGLAAPGLPRLRSGLPHLPPGLPHLPPDLPHLPPGFAADRTPPVVSTASREFAEILGELQSVTDALVAAPVVAPRVGSPAAAAHVGSPAAAPHVGSSASASAAAAAAPVPPAPARLIAGVGDLIVVAGTPGDALSVARAMSFTVQADVVVAGSAVGEGLDRIDDRRGAITARARGVERERIVIAAYGLTAGQSVTDQAASLAVLRGDQLWLAVDSGRKPEDTARWVSALSAVVSPDAVAALGRDATASPESVRELGLPTSWSYDG